VRLWRWQAHFGTPTLAFLLTYNQAISASLRYFQEKKNPVSLPWAILPASHFVTDTANTVLVNPHAIEQVILPMEEKTGHFIETHNPTGGFTTTPADPISQAFIQYASTLIDSNSCILDIGAGFGAATLPVCIPGVTVFCNDIESHNLAVIHNRYKKKFPQAKESMLGDFPELIFVPGNFPDELTALPKKSFAAILICRVLHFFTGNKIQRSLQQLGNLLQPGGKLFVVCETPYLKNWQRFIPEYEARVQMHQEWPGEITMPAQYESSGRSAKLPTFVHWITKEILERTLHQGQWDISHLAYIDRQHQFPEDLLLDGRESIGAIATREHP